MSYRDAEMEYGVPIATLSYPNNGKNNSHKVGPKKFYHLKKNRSKLFMV